jgi:hypothetical protein
MKCTIYPLTASNPIARVLVSTAFQEIEFKTLLVMIELLKYQIQVERIK